MPTALVKQGKPQHHSMDRHGSGIISMNSESDPLTKDPPLPNIDSGNGSEQAATASRKGSNMLSASQVEKRRDFTKKQNLRRQVYRDLTVFRMFPLQAMAMDDYDQHVKDYFSGDKSSTLDEDDESSDGSEDVQQRRRGAEEAKRSSSDCEKQREQFLREFLEEKSVQVPSVAVAGDGASAETGVEKHSDRGLVEEPTQNDNSSGAADGGECNSYERNATIKYPDDKENMPQPVSITSGNDRQAKSFRPKEQSTNESTKSPSDLGHIHTQQKQQFLSTLWSMEPRIFAMETALKGKRRYISAHLGRFMDHYWRECDVYNRHYYELIKEGSPCRLYFDLEFNKRSNPHLTPTITEDLLTELFDELRQEFQNKYNISIERSCMVDLDSSTPKKFSRHWILHLPKGELFSDAREAGVFVKVLVSRLEEDQESGDLQSRGHELLADNLFVNAEDSTDEHPKLTRFIDLGVYTRNRIFRLLGSTKFGKPADAALRIAEANEFPFPVGFDNTKFYFPEMGDGPPTDPDADNSPDGVDNFDDFERFCNSLSFEDHATSLAATLVVPANSSKLYYPILIDPSNLLSDDEKQQIPLLKQLNGSGPISAMSKFPRAARQYGQSPFPKLEHFILNTLGKRKGLIGNICTWSLGTQQPLPCTVSFTMKDNRYCDNIGRAHKSNNIIWNVHLMDRICWQCCHDPECHGFRGVPIDLPDEVNMEIEEYFVDYELSKLNESEVLKQTISEEDREFDDPTLEAAMRQLDISSVARETNTETALNNTSALGSYTSTSEEDREFDDPTLEAAMREFDISSVVRETNTETALDNRSLDDELPQLNLSDIESSNEGVLRDPPPVDDGHPNADVSNLSVKPIVQSTGDRTDVIKAT